MEKIIKSPYNIIALVYVFLYYQVESMKATWYENHIIFPKILLYIGVVYVLASFIQIVLSVAQDISINAMFNKRRNNYVLVSFLKKLLIVLVIILITFFQG